MEADYHVHSHYSDDSWYVMESVVKDAIQLGLEEICFTDHVDYGIKTDWLSLEAFKSGEAKATSNVHYDSYLSEIIRLSETYQDRIKIKRGLEFGMQAATIPQFEKLFETYEVDFILLSVHQIDNQEFWTGEFQKGRQIQECYDRYYDELEQLVTTYKNYSVLAHMDLIRRYLDKDLDSFADNQEKITRILRQVIADNKGIELNTSSDRYGVAGLTPSIEILQLYYELGGKILTIGSDSHEAAHLGYGIDESKEILKKIGFRHFCTFEKMTPIFHQL